MGSFLRALTPGAGCRLLYNEIYADIAKIFCHKGPTGDDAERQWFVVIWCGTRTTREDQRMGSGAAEGV